MSEKRSNLLGPDHPHTLSSLNNLATCYQETGETQNAISIHRDVSEKLSNLLGPDHPDTLSSLNNLAKCYYQIGETEKALSIHRDVLEKRLFQFVTRFVAEK